MVVSSEMVATSAESGLKTAFTTSLSCPTSGSPSGCRVATSQSRTVGPADHGEHGPVGIERHGAHPFGLDERQLTQ